MLAACELVGVPARRLTVAAFAPKLSVKQIRMRPSLKQGGGSVAMEFAKTTVGVT